MHRLYGGGIHADPDDVTPDWSDLRGGLDDNGAPFNVAYWYYDGDHLMFRIRIDQAPQQCTDVWQVLLDTDTDDGVDWVLQVDFQSDDAVELSQATVEGPTIGDVEFNSTPSWTGDIAIYHECQDPASDGSYFDGEADVFNDLAMPWSTLSSLTGITKHTPLRVGLSTATQDNVINKDYPLGLSDADAIADVFSDEFLVPEPTTIGLVAIGLFGIGARLRNRRRAA